jgi:two-component system NtrC family response regulator
MKLELPRMGHEVTICPDGLTAVAALERNSYDCVLVDLDMPGLNGIDVIAKAREFSSDVDAVVLTGKSSLETAVAALRQGAFDYLTKPCKLADLDALLQRIGERRELSRKFRALKRQVEQLEGAPKLVGESKGMHAVRELIAKVAPTDSTVLVLGETGAGKELVARAVHDQSLRAEMPYVAINCGALPENLIESELFGHRRGAFTGADEHRVGLFEVADGGTLFLDEIGELPKSLQANLLRVLESGEVRRVGENKPFNVDVRVVCATHRDLDEMVAAGDFREDLMYRINTFEIAIPPLRRRPEDIPQLALHLLSRYRRTVRPDDALFSADLMESLSSHTWPGNVRELANVIEHAAILSGGGLMTREHLPSRFGSRRGKVEGLKALSELTLREIEMQAIHEALERHQGSKPKAAEQLGVSLKTLYNKLNQASDLERSA